MTYLPSSLTIVPSSHPARRRIGAGITLIEVVVSIVLVSTVLLGSLAVSANLARNNHDRRDATQGQQLAARILDEVTSRDFQDRVDPVLGIEAGEVASDRTTFDDVDDYSGFTSTPPTHRDSSLISGYDGWSMSVVVTPANLSAGGITTAGADQNSPLRMVSVTCVSPDGTITEAKALVSNIPNDAGETTSYEQWRRLQFSFPDRDLDVSVPLRNSPLPIF